ncbi:MAG: AAA family ATPase [Acidobacteriia bacterium]|nr:AAA family ATPase [Terriglobia bacterium]
MYIRRVLIRNIRSIAELEWRPADKGPGWHVILGDNGSGKSSFLRSVALALVGPKEAVAARQDWNTWLRSGEDSGFVRIDLVPDIEYDSFSGRGRTGNTNVLSASVRLDRVEESGLEVELEKRVTPKRVAPERHVWGTGAGWFSAAFGPFRRFTGGDKEAERSFLSNPKLGAHISVFGENVALTEGLYWLRELNYKKLEHSPEGGLLRRLKQFVNQEGFLSHSIKLKDVSSRGVEFEDANGFPVSVEELSDGYRSVLSMTFELIRQLGRHYSEERIFDDQNLRVTVPGVVMVDEIDAHLHPTWQKKVGFWLTEHFPNFQFIVTTHSPLICQASVKGSIFLLPRPGTEEEGRILKGADRDRLVYGDILDAYSTEAFGAGVTRSPEAHKMQERLATLNVKELKHGISAEEKAEQQRLRAAFPTSSHLQNAL